MVRRFVVGCGSVPMKEDEVAYPNAGDPALLDWLRAAKPGDYWPDGQGVECVNARRVSVKAYNLRSTLPNGNWLPVEIREVVRARNEDEGIIGPANWRAVPWLRRRDGFRSYLVMNDDGALYVVMLRVV